MRAAARITGASVTTVMKLWLDAGDAARDFHYETVQGEPTAIAEGVFAHGGAGGMG